MSALHEMTANELVEAFAQAKASPVEVINAVFDRLDAVESRINAFRETDREGALQAARASEARWQAGTQIGPLDGIPISVKDLVPARGMNTLHGSLSVDPKTQDTSFDAPAVARLREAGAVIFGKTTTSEFGTHITTNPPLTGMTRNPWNTDRHAGGSSGGSGAALAAGIGPMSLGTDGGGSVRIPSAWCGTVGLKPSFKRVPTVGEGAFGSLSNIGPMTRSVADAALMLNVMAQGCASDWQGMEHCDTDFSADLCVGIKGLRIAYSPDLGIADVAPDIAAKVAEAVALLSDLGAHVEEIAPPPPLQGYIHENGGSLHGVQWIVTLYHRLSHMSEEARARVSPAVRELAAIAEEIPQQALVEAQAQRNVLGAGMHAFLEPYDALVLPSYHFSAPIGPEVEPHVHGTPPLTSWCNQTMQPALSLPCGHDDAGMPVGLQIVSRRYCDSMVLRIAAAYEAARGAFPLAPLQG